MVSIRELGEYQDSTIKSYKRAIRDVRERFGELPKGLEKHIEVIQSNLDTYEIMYDTLVEVREVSSKIMKSEELETIEREMKLLNETFWN